jgi:hypothetical protein
MMLTSTVFDQSLLAQLFEHDHDPVLQDYRSFSSLIDWT